MVVRKKLILQFLATGMDLEGILLNKISQRKKDKYNNISLPVVHRKTKQDCRQYQLMKIG